MQTSRFGRICFSAVILFALSHCTYAQAQSAIEHEQTLALPNHPGELAWTAPGFKITQNSAKPGGGEIGVRAQDASGRIGLLGFLFLFPEEAPMTSAKCRDGVLGPEKKAVATYRELSSSESPRSGGISVATVSYSVTGSDHMVHYSLRSFVASGDICGDLEIYSSEPIHSEDAGIQPILASYRLDPGHKPDFADVSKYAEVLFRTQQYKDAALLYEQALGMVPADGAPFPSAKLARRIVTDQAGMAYGISGQYGKARPIFEAGVATDPEYPMYYYNLACADAGENKLEAAKAHLEQAFAHKAGINPGEPLPDPTKDDSFLPYKGNTGFWGALQRMQAGN